MPRKRSAAACREVSSPRIFTLATALTETGTPFNVYARLISSGIVITFKCMYSTFSRSGMRSAAPPLDHAIADNPAVGQLALPSAEDGDGVRRDLEVVAADQPHRREEPEQDADDDQWQPEIAHTKYG